MVKIQPLDLSAAGVAYLKRQLQSQQCPLSSAVAKMMNGRDDSFALVPQGTSTLRAQEFNRGGLMKMGESHRWFADYIQSHWPSQKCRLVFEDPWMNQKEYEMHPPAIRYFFNRSKPYLISDNSDFYHALNEGMREVKNFLLLGFIISPVDEIPDNAQDVTDDFISALAKNTHAAFASAYDQESYVVWKRTTDIS